MPLFRGFAYFSCRYAMLFRCAAFSRFRHLFFAIIFFLRVATMLLPRAADITFYSLFDAFRFRHYLLRRYYATLCCHAIAAAIATLSSTC